MRCRSPVPCIYSFRSAIYGWPVETLQPNLAAIVAMIHPDDLALANAAWNDALQESSPMHIQFPICNLRLAGRDVTAKSCCHRCDDSSGRPGARERCVERCVAGVQSHAYTVSDLQSTAGRSRRYSQILLPSLR